MEAVLLANYQLAVRICTVLPPLKAEINEHPTTVTTTNHLAPLFPDFILTISLCIDLNL